MSRVSQLSPAPPTAAPVIPFSDRDWVHQLMDEAASDGPLDAQEILSQHPALRCSKSAVIDLAYEEYCRRVEAGEALDPEQFAQRFPGYQTSLIRQIEAHHDFAAELPELFAASVVWPLTGEEFLGFRLGEELGRGAFSRVFLAEELALGDRLVVAKVSRLAGMEPQALGRLRHPHIVPVHSVQADDDRGLSLICLPFFGRATLCDLLDCAFRTEAPPRQGSVVRDALRDANRGHEEPNELPRQVGPAWWETSYANAILTLAVQIADALASAHGSGIYHCDLKPSNVLLCPSGAKLFDFNLSRGADVIGGQGGTLPYMAPEQLRAVTGEDESPRIDGRTDLFSLGVVLHELFTGKLPWGRVASDLPAADVAAELLQRYRRLPSLRDATGVNPSLARLIEKCLAYEPGDRPASSPDLAAALRAELRPLRRGARFGLQHRRAAIAAMGAACLGSAGVIYTWQTAERPAIRRGRLGREAFESQQFERAIRHFDAVLRESPDDRLAWFFRGRARMLLGRYDEAREDFAYLDKLVPKNGLIWACLGTCDAAQPRRHADDYGSATAFFRVAMQSQPNNAALCNNLGYCELQANKVGLAEKLFQKAIDLNRSEPVSHYHLASLLVRSALERGKGRNLALSSALGHLEKAIGAEPRTAAFHLLCAEILCRQLDNRQEPDESRKAKIEAALDHCEAAWDFGASAAELDSATFPWQPLQVMQRYYAIPTRPRVIETPVQVVPLLDPLADVDLSSLDLSR